MNKKRTDEIYDRIAVGRRIQQKRQLLDISQEELAERIDRATKYISDIERGICGMSIETMMSITRELDMSLDYMIYGSGTTNLLERQSNDMLAVEHLLSVTSDIERAYAVRLLKVFLAGMRSVREESVEQD